MAEEKVKHIRIEDGNTATDEELKKEVKEGQTDEEEKQAEAETENENICDGSDACQTDDAVKADAKTEEDESERYMRLMAEFQNFKRRAAKEKSDIHAYANERIIGDLLPVLDNFERALETGVEDAEGYAKGMQLIFTQLKTALEKAGLSEIPAIGEVFDPNVHNAVMTDNSDEHDDGKITRVLQKGYKLNDKVIRPSMVSVVRK